MKLVERAMPLVPERAAPQPAALPVLLLEDAPEDAEPGAGALQRAEGVRIALTHVVPLAEARARLAADDYRLTLADLSVSDSQGADTVARLVEVARGPVVALTGSSDPQLRAATLAAGAYDFVGKSELQGATLARLVRWASVRNRAMDGDARRDTSAQRLFEARILRLSRLYAFVSAINETILRAKSAEQLLERVCELAIRHQEFATATVFMAEPGTQWLKATAVRGKTVPFTQAIRLTTDKTLPEGRGILGRAIRSGAPAVANDYQTDPRLAP